MRCPVSFKPLSGVPDQRVAGPQETFHCGATHPGSSRVALPLFLRISRRRDFNSFVSWGRERVWEAFLLGFVRCVCEPPEAVWKAFVRP